MKVGIVSYGMGNVGSVRRALEELGSEVVLMKDPGQLSGADRIVLPGVGAFGEAMSRLSRRGWPEALRRQVDQEGVALLGICLGMQMLADSSEEEGWHEGLGLVSGRVRRLDAYGCALRIPHVGWNEVRHSASPLFRDVPQETDFYFVHSYAFETRVAADTVATTSYGVEIAAAVGRGRCFGTQFHPEKSSKAGRAVLRNFIENAPC